MVLPQVICTAVGGLELQLTVPGSDVWASVLTAMVVVRGSGYDPVGIQVERAA